MISMDAKKLYERLDMDFGLANLHDEWGGMEFNDFISKNFQNRQMGVFTDNSVEINQVYTAVFPSDKVIKHVLNTGKENVLIFTHHPMIWDIRKPEVFSYINKWFFQELKDRGISIYVSHIPLDKNGLYSTSVSLAKALDIEIEKEFFVYLGVYVGVIGSTEIVTLEELVKVIEEVVGHHVKLTKYGSNKIKNGKIAVVGGGGNNKSVLEELVKHDVNTFITGVTVKNDYSKDAHDYAMEHNVNIIGATHYSTEKFACMAMCKYFKSLGLPCKFIDDIPIFEDMY